MIEEKPHKKINLFEKFSLFEYYLSIIDDKIDEERKIYNADPSNDFNRGVLCGVSLARDLEWRVYQKMLHMAIDKLAEINITLDPLAHIDKVENEDK